MMLSLQRFRAFLGVLAVLPAASCIAFGGPAPTDTSPNKAVNGFPAPTQAPSIVELRKRQSNSEAETCGYIDGDYSSYVGCEVGLTCMLYKPGGNDVGMAGCCEGSNHQDCGWASSCIDYDGYYSSSSCNSDCQSNTFIRKCTSAASPYCYSYTYPHDNVQDFGCTDDPSIDVETVLQTASDINDDTTSIALVTLSGDDVNTEEGGSGGGGGGGGRRKKKRKISIGAIVGAAIGGLAVLLLLVGLIVFCLFRARKRRQLAQNQSAYTAPQGGNQNYQQSGFTQETQQQQQTQSAVPVTGAYGSSQQQQPGQQGYYGQSGADQKYNYQTHVQEQPVQSSTPAPSYAQPGYTTTAATTTPANHAPAPTGQTGAGLFSAPS